MGNQLKKSIMKRFEENKNDLINYSSIEQILNQGIEDFMSETLESEDSQKNTENVDWKLFDELERKGLPAGSTGGRLYSFVLSFVRDVKKRGLNENITEKDLMDFYKYQKENHVERFGESCKNLLEKYLFKKNILILKD